MTLAAVYVPLWLLGLAVWVAVVLVGYGPDLLNAVRRFLSPSSRADA